MSVCSTTSIVIKKTNAKTENTRSIHFPNPRVSVKGREDFWTYPASVEQRRDSPNLASPSRGLLKISVKTEIITRYFDS